MRKLWGDNNELCIYKTLIINKELNSKSKNAKISLCFNYYIIDRYLSLEAIQRLELYY